VTTNRTGQPHRDEEPDAEDNKKVALVSALGSALGLIVFFGVG